MKTNFRTTISMILLILVMCVSLTNTTSVLADEGSPTEPPIPTEVPTDEPTEPPALPTDLPADATPVPEEIIATPPAEEAPVEEVLSQIPDDTSIIVLDENGNPVSLASQEAAEIVVNGDPQWCPVGVLPGDPSCSTAYATIALLIGNMQSNTSFYDHDGTIYFTSGASGASFNLTTSSLGSSDFSSLRGNNWILQGGWNGLSGASATFTGVTDFGTNTITIGDSHSSNRDWDGNLTLSNFAFSGASSTALSIFVEDGNVALNNISVTNQTNETYAGFLDVDNGNISVQNGFFDGNAAGESRGFNANTNNGSITISNTTFQQSNNAGNNAGDIYNGATLGADVITLTNVTATQNDGNGIFMDNPDLVFLNNVVATNNGTDPPGSGTSNTVGSGVNIDGGGGSDTLVFVNGGTFSNNQRYGVQVSNSTIVVLNAPSCSGNIFAAAGTANCYSETAFIDSVAPNTNITGGPSGMTNNPNPSFSFNGTDNYTPANYLTFECQMDGGGFTSCSSPKGYSGLADGNHNFSVRAKDLSGNVDQSPASRSFTVDSIPPVVTITFPAPNGANGWFTTNPVGGSVSATDNITVASLTCSGSGVSTGPLNGGGTTSASRTISVSGSGSHNVTCTASDGASNVSDSETIRIDTTPPSINYIGRTPSANGAGWNNSPVTLGWLCFDLFGSGAVDLLIGETVSSEGSNQSSTGICQDNAGLTSSNTQGGINIDMTKPVITGSRLPAPNGNGWNNTNVVVSFSCADSLSGINTNTVAGATVSAQGAGQSVTNTGTCTDRAGNVATPVTIGGINIDKTAPVITLPVVPPVEATSAAGASVTYSASVTDNLDGSISVSCSPASGSTFPISTTTVTCTSTDHAGNTAMGFFNVTVRDTTAPIIASHADVTAEASSALGAIVSYTSPSTSDVVDGAETATCLPASGSQFALGNTTVTCNATDAHGNAATSITFVVHVLDTTAPVIAFHGDVTAEATSALGAIITYTSPSTSDAVDGPGTATCLPASGSQFAIGNTTVTCNATDTHGNVSAPTTFTVHVVDTIPPVISPHGDETAEATSALGAIVTYTSPSTSDIVDGAGTATCLPVSGSQFALGDTTITCNATDAHGNSAAPTTFVIHVVDTTPPVISPTGDMFLKIAKKSGDEINYLPPKTTDIVDGMGIATCTPAPGSSFPIGFTIVTCTAVDAHGNTAIPVTFAIDLEYHVASTESVTTDLFIPVTGISTIDLTCITPGSFRVQTEGARFIFNNLCGYQAAVEGVEKDSLPGKSPNSSTFVSSFTVNILKDGKAVKPLPADANINILFEIPAGQQNKNFTVFEWNGKEWVEVAGQKTADGFFNITVTESGTFMFVAKQ